MSINDSRPLYTLQHSGSNVVLSYNDVGYSKFTRRTFAF